MKIGKNGLCLALALSLSLAGFGGYWTENGVTFYYTVSDGEACVSIDHCGNSASVVIPSEINGYKVTSIGETRSDCHAKLASVVIPNGVRNIGNRAFMRCDSLTAITIPDSVTSIGESAFDECSSLASVTIPSSVTIIGGAAFYECSSLTSVEIPSSVASILDYAFSGCNGLTSVTIPGGVTKIGDHAFYNCNGLTSVVIQAGVTGIGWKAFYCCSNLTSVTIPDSVTSIELDAFADCPLLYDEKTMKGLDLVDGWVVGYNSDCPSDLILEDVRGIAGSAFKDCSGLTSVTISDSVTSIGVSAFEGCQGLANSEGFVIVKEVLYDYIGEESVVTIPSGVTSVSGNAFERCTSLTSVTIPNSVTSIEYAAFESCSSLTSVTIPNSVTSIDDYVFYGCSNLSMVTIPNSVTSIGNSAFYDCTSLTSVTIPDSVTSIGRYAFAKCGLSEVSVSERTKIDESAFDSGVVITRRPVEVIPSVDGDEGATVTGDAASGWTVTPSADATSVVVTIPNGVDAAKVKVVVSPETKRVTPNGATVKVMRDTADITDYLVIPSADASGIIDLSAATVKEEIAKEPLDAAKGAIIDFASPSKPSLTTAPTREGLVYRLKEGETLEAMAADTAGDTKIGDGTSWTPTISVTGGTSGFYTIEVTK